jgi:hypothetical protein
MRVCGRTGTLVAAAVFCVAASVQPAAAQAVVADLPIPSGASERAAFLAAPQARGTVILLAGGEGIVNIDGSGYSGSTNFLIRTHRLWAPYAINAAILGAPDGRSLLGQRSKAVYAAALGVAADFARSRSNVPVWLVGTSQGSTAAINGAAHLGAKVAGAVLTSSVTRLSRAGETVYDAEPGAVRVPTLVVANVRDTCPASPPGDTQNLLAAMPLSPRREALMFDSSAIQSDPCGALSPHGYLGIEGIVIGRIAAWINAAPGY